MKFVEPGHFADPDVAARRQMTLFIERPIQ
jgi:hypothetical protein